MNLKNFQTPHAVLLVLGLLATTLPHLAAIVPPVEAAFPASVPTLTKVASVLAFLTMLVGMFTPSASAKDGKPGGGAGTKAAIVGAAFLLVGCSWFQSHEALFPSPTQTACVLGMVEAGQTDPMAIMTTCNIDRTLEQDVITLIEGGVSAKKARLAGHAPACGDAGVEAGK